MSAIIFQEARVEDALAIAALHALSWQQNYQSVFSSDYLHSKVLEERKQVWLQRLQHPKPNQYILLAKKDGELYGFACSFFNEDPQYGTLLDNLHIRDIAKGTGIGRILMAKTAEKVASLKEENKGLYLWVVQDNDKAFHFYTHLGAQTAETLLANDIGDKDFYKTRMVWPSCHLLLPTN